MTLIAPRTDNLQNIRENTNNYQDLQQEQDYRDSEFARMVRADSTEDNTENNRTVEQRETRQEKDTKALAVPEENKTEQQEKQEKPEKPEPEILKTSETVTSENAGQRTRQTAEPDNRETVLKDEAVQPTEDGEVVSPGFEQNAVQEEEPQRKNSEKDSISTHKEGLEIEDAVTLEQNSQKDAFNQKPVEASENFQNGVPDNEAEQAQGAVKTMESNRRSAGMINNNQNSSNEPANFIGKADQVKSGEEKNRGTRTASKQEGPELRSQAEQEDVKVRVSDKRNTNMDARGQNSQENNSNANTGFDQSIRENTVASNDGSADARNVSFMQVETESANMSNTKDVPVAQSLRNAFEGKTNNRIAKQAGFILKNNDTGEIRLMLKPESLGKVRIRLDMQDNRIAGRIFVENINVREAMEQNLQSLQRAFQEEGFQLESLDVFVDSEETGSEGSRDEEQNNNGADRSAREFEANVPEAEEITAWDGHINLVV
ncbi:MAG: flagellar hook-length control protein FliK [Spirochaetia bacterium]